MNKKIDLESPLKRVHLPIESASGLPNECYTEHSAFEQDRELVFAPGWSCIGFGSDVPAEWAVPIELMGLPLLITRDSNCLLYTSPSPRDRTRSRMPSSA